MAFLKYFLIRVGILIPLFVIFMAIGLGIIVSAVAATLMAFCIAYLFFRPQRNAAAESVRSAVSPEARRLRASKQTTDGDIEDALIEDHPDLRIDTDQKIKKASSSELRQAENIDGSRHV
ncbi:DUF4229 domain-containing protein [Psychromicrobium lacuslunae]|uniref:DUF4229 domain-containing protein n=1 Tax=Psychromicrobium lacuslunae TaxID=1618207 RepID=UPI0005D2E773|nr:DUF4229 domain-containing protein [Psychromicrobium lacuslunae]